MWGNVGECGISSLLSSGPSSMAGFLQSLHGDKTDINYTDD